jgi:hypothetical protein
MQQFQDLYPAKPISMSQMGRGPAQDAHGLPDVWNNQDLSGGGFLAAVQNTPAGAIMGDQTEKLAQGAMAKEAMLLSKTATTTGKSADVASTNAEKATYGISKIDQLIAASDDANFIKDLLSRRKQLTDLGIAGLKSETAPRGGARVPKPVDPVVEQKRINDAVKTMSSDYIKLGYMAGTRQNTEKYLINQLKTIDEPKIAQAFYRRWQPEIDKYYAKYPDAAPTQFSPQQKAAGDAAGAKAKVAADAAATARQQKINELRKLQGK